MFTDTEALLKEPLYIFDLPDVILQSLQLHNALKHTETTETTEHSRRTASSPSRSAGEATRPFSRQLLSCNLCQRSFENVLEQRLHARSDWHAYNVKQKVHGSLPVEETVFTSLLEDLDLSLSGTDSSSSADDRNIVLRGERTAASEGHTESFKSNVEDKPKGSPLFYFNSSALPDWINLCVYRAILPQTSLDDQGVIEAIRMGQLSPNTLNLAGSSIEEGSKKDTEPEAFLCMAGGGHFAAMIISLKPQPHTRRSGTVDCQGTVIAHKTFHRYTTRRKQGGAQSKNDSAKGAANSAGAQIRRHNELALEYEVRNLLNEWRQKIKDCRFIFVRASGMSSKRILFGPYENQVLRKDDPRIKSFPFSTRRATRNELMRAFTELTRVKVSRRQSSTEPSEDRSPICKIPEKHFREAEKEFNTPSILDSDDDRSIHIAQLQALIRRSKAPAVLSYMERNSLSPDFPMHRGPAAPGPSNTLLHHAASMNSVAVITSLLVKAKANPTIKNERGKVPFDLTGNRSAQDAFRTARWELGELAWDWEAAKCPPALDPSKARVRSLEEKQDNEISGRNRWQTELDPLESSATPQTVRTGRSTGPLGKSALERREQDSRGLTEEMKKSVLRERVARAAEQRMRGTTG